IGRGSQTEADDIGKFCKADGNYGLHNVLVAVTIGVQNIDVTPGDLGRVFVQLGGEVQESLERHGDFRRRVIERDFFRLRALNPQHADHLTMCSQAVSAEIGRRTYEEYVLLLLASESALRGQDRFHKL